MKQKEIEEILCKVEGAIKHGSEEILIRIWETGHSVSSKKVEEKKE